MAILLALLSAIGYGAGDFTAGLASRRLNARVVTPVTQAMGLLAALLALALFSGVGPRGSALAWGALSGVGSAVGTLALYQGLAVGRMTVVATLSGVLTALIPVIVGVALGNSLSSLAVIGIVIAIPAILLVSWQPRTSPGEGEPSGAVYGIVAGIGFGLLLVAIDQAGTRSGAWPVVSGQFVSVLLLCPLAFRGLRQTVASASRSAVLLTIGTGVLTGAANLLFLAATGHGELAVLAVLTALYPAVTVLLARTLLAEHWTRSQVVGLFASAAAVVLVSVG